MFVVTVTTVGMLDPGGHNESTIQLFKYPPFPGQMINYCIPSIQTPTFDTIIPISEHSHFTQLK